MNSFFMKSIQNDNFNIIKLIDFHKYFKNFYDFRSCFTIKSNQIKSNPNQIKSQTINYCKFIKKKQMQKKITKLIKKEKKTIKYKKITSNK